MSELTLLYIVLAASLPILVVWLVCWLCTRKRTVDTFEPWTVRCHNVETPPPPTKLFPEDVKAEAHDSLFLRFADGKLSELKRRKDE